MKTNFLLIFAIIIFFIGCTVEDIPYIPHECDFREVITTNPNCYIDGKITLTCSCGEKNGTKIAPKLTGSNCSFTGEPIKPNRTATQITADIKAVYDNYRKNLQQTASGNYYTSARGTGQDGARCDTQSEAHGYGMMIYALMGEKAIFDGFNQLRKAHPSITNPDLMSWVVFPEHINNINPSQTPAGYYNGPPGRRSSATDGDLDMAYALLLAHKKWGGSYKDEAIKIIEAIKMSSMHRDNFRTSLGDWNTVIWGTEEYITNGTQSRPSDWMPGHFRAFYKATNDNFWQSSTDMVYIMLSQVENSETGLVPDFAVGVPARPDPQSPVNENDNFIHYSYNACRVPWRLATDFIHNKEVSAQLQINRISSWLRSSRGADGVVGNIKDGYELDGTPLSNSPASMPYIAPFAAGMTGDPYNQDFLNEAYDFIRKQTPRDAYGAAIQLLCMLLITGNWDAPN